MLYMYYTIHSIITCSGSMYYIVMFKKKSANSFIITIYSINAFLTSQLFKVYNAASNMYTRTIPNWAQSSSLSEQLDSSLCEEHRMDSLQFLSVTGRSKVRSYFLFFSIPLQVEAPTVYLLVMTRPLAMDKAIKIGAREAPKTVSKAKKTPKMIKKAVKRTV